MSTRTFENEIADIFHGSLGLDPPAPDVDLVATGLIDSLSIVNLITELESCYAVRIPLHRVDLESIRTLGGLQALIDAAPAPEVREDSSVLQLLRQGTGRPVFVLHTSWGGAQTAAPLARGLDTERPVYVFQAEYYRSSATTPVRLEAIAAAYIREVRSVQPHGPYALAGYSFGGLIAYEMAVQLSEDGEDVDLLGMVDTYTDMAVLDAEARLVFRTKLAIWDAKESLKRILRAPAAELPGYLRKLRNRIAGRGAQNEPLSKYVDLPEDIRRAIEIARLIQANYRPSAYSGDAILFLAEQRTRPQFDPQKVWKRRVKGTLRIAKIPGEHGDLQQDAWDTIGAVLSPLLNNSPARTSSPL